MGGKRPLASSSEPASPNGGPGSVTTQVHSQNLGNPCHSRQQLASGMPSANAPAVLFFGASSSARRKPSIGDVPRKFPAVHWFTNITPLGHVETQFLDRQEIGSSFAPFATVRVLPSDIFTILMQAARFSPSPAHPSINFRSTFISKWPLLLAEERGPFCT